MTKGFDLRCGAGKTARVWVQGKGGVLKPGQAMVLLPLREREDEHSLAEYLAPLRQTLIDNNERHVNVIVCESDCRALKRGINHVPVPWPTGWGALSNYLPLLLSRDRCPVCKLL